MKFLKKLKSSNFWVSMISAVVLILQAVFNVEIKTEYLNQIIMAILGLLVMSGIVTDSAGDEVKVSQEFDIDSVKEGLTQVMSSITSTFSTSVSDVIKQFDSIKETFKGDKEQSAFSNESVKRDAEPSIISNAVEQVIEQPAVSNIVEQKNEDVKPLEVVEKVAVQPIVDPDNML